jgi:hypothetical protein
VISKPDPRSRIKRNDRLTILRPFTREIALLEGISHIKIAVNKQGKSSHYDVLDRASTALLQRFGNTMRLTDPASELEEALFFLRLRKRPTISADPRPL